MRVKNYSQIARQAKSKTRAKGKVRIKAYGGSIGSCFAGGTNSGAFMGPSLSRRLYGWAVASTLVTVNLENSSFQGRIISVDSSGFEITVTNPLTSVFTVGAIVYVNQKQVNAVSAGNI